MSPGKKRKMVLAFANMFTRFKSARMIPNVKDSEVGQVMAVGCTVDGTGSDVEYLRGNRMSGGYCRKDRLW